MENNTIGKVLFTEEQIRQRAAELGKQISEDYAGEEIYLVGTLKGAVMWMGDLMKHITNDTQIDFVVASSYGSGTESSGVVKIIKDLAEKESCVIVGRCADYILKDNPNCINVFICADRADRIKRIAERYDVSEKKALDRIKRMDRERKYYYETHTGQEWGSISSHEILLNASLLGIEGTVDILEGIYKR